MPLVTGTKLGRNEIVPPVGAGGLAGIRAKGTKLKRDEALKVLPEAFASDPRFTQFRREPDCGGNAQRAVAIALEMRASAPLPDGRGSEADAAPTEMEGSSDAGK